MNLPQKLFEKAKTCAHIKNQSSLIFNEKSEIHRLIFNQSNRKYENKCLNQTKMIYYFVFYIMWKTTSYHKVLIFCSLKGSNSDHSLLQYINGMHLNVWYSIRLDQSLIAFPV